jgi:hypothetical protein
LAGSLKLLPDDKTIASRGKHEWSNSPYYAK